MKIINLFLPMTLLNHPKRSQIGSILTAAIEAVEPGEAVRRFLHRNGNFLQVIEERIDLSQFAQIYLISFGKAAMPMSSALVEILGDQLTCGWVAPKHVSSEHDPRLIIQPGSHPLPDEKSLRAANFYTHICTFFTCESFNPLDYINFPSM